MIMRSLPVHWCSVLLVSALFTGGCAFAPVSGKSPVVVQSYDLPDTIDVNRVIHAVELAFAHALATTPWIVEGSVRSPLPARPASFTLEERRVHLDRLGVVTIHEVGCPESLASVHAWIAERTESLAPHRYTGCIQLYAGAYRVHLIDSRLVLKSSHGLSGSSETSSGSHSDLLSRLAQAFLEQITEAREVTASSTPESLPETPDGGSFAHGRGRDVVTTSLLVCLAPKHEAAAVRTQSGGGPVIQVLERGSLTVGTESVDAGYFRVKTAEGLAGWVDRSDVSRLPCPVG